MSPSGPQARGFRLRPEEAVGGGQLRPVLNKDGTTATDTTPLEEMTQLAPMFEKVARLEQEVKEKAIMGDVNLLRGHVNDLATAVDNTVVELLARI